MTLGCPLRYFALAVFLAAGRTLAQVPTPSPHEQAAREVLQLLGVARTAEAGAEAMMGTVRANKDLAPYEDVFRAWYKKILSGGDLEGEMAQLYMRHFTEDELRGIAAFYRSRLGQKVILTLPEVMKEGAEIGMKRAQDHTGELEEMLAKAREERAPKNSSH